MTIKDILEKLENKNSIIGLFVSTFAVYFLMILVTIPRIHELSNGMTIPDLTVGYDADYVYLFLTEIGELGRQYYLVQILVDMFYPFLFGLTFYLMGRWYIKKYPETKIPRFVLLLSPWLITLFDYSENIICFTMIIQFPKELIALGWIIPWATIFKFVFNIISTITGIYIIIIAIFKK